MSDHDELENASTTEGLPVAPSLGPALVSSAIPAHSTFVSWRIVWISLVCILLAVVAALVAQALIHLIHFITNLAFYGRLSFASAVPTTEVLGLWVIVVPVVGGLVVGLMARYGAKAIRGHGIPEAMEQVLLNRSRIPARLTFLKPTSAAIAIGTGGPFGAEGPIIATGGALGSWIGQVLPVTADERKTLLSAGAAAGMAATFGAPVSAVLLAVELLLFEFRPRSLIPVALATSAAAAMRIVFEGAEPIFAMSDLTTPVGVALAAYIALGAVIGLLSVMVTKAIYVIEDGFERLPIHWMWWPAIGAVAVGIIGYFVPRTLGVGYYNITEIISADLSVGFVLWLILAKFLSWSIYLGSGTSGGTLAPLFTIGGGAGLALGAGAAWIMPEAGIDLRIAALVGMAAIFAGSSRALLASVVFAFETTLQPLGLLPLLGGCAAAFLVSSLLMRTTIMTEKIARRGVRVPADYAPDFLDLVQVRDVATGDVRSLRADQSLGEVRQWIDTPGAHTTHQGFPVLDSADRLVGVVTRRQLLNAGTPDDRPVRDLITQPPVVVYDDCTLREAADHMVNHDVGRLPVVDRDAPSRLVGIITRSDLLRAHRRRLHDQRERRRHWPPRPTASGSRR